MSAVLSLEDAKAHLNITGGDADDELATVVAAAEAAVVARVGPIDVETRTVRVNGCTSLLVLPTSPVVSVTSLASTDGTAVDVDDLTVDSEVGTLEYTDSCGYFGSDRYDVTYVAGWSYPPDDIVFAVKELVRHLWSTQRGSSVRPGSSIQDAAPGYLLPNRVLELLEPYRTPRIS